MVAGEGQRRALVDEERVGGAVAGARDDAQRPVARSDRLAVGQPHVGSERLRPVAQEVPEGFVAPDDLLRDAVVAHQRVREAAVLLDGVVIALGVVGQRVQRRDRRPGPALDRGGEAEVVDVVVCDEHQLDVLDTQSLGSQAVLESRQCGRVAQAGVDQREWVAEDNPGIDRPDMGERQRDLHNTGVHEVNSSMA